MGNYLFLGDSITDCGHLFQEDNLGNGYVQMIHSELCRQSSITPIVSNYGYDGFTVNRMVRMWKDKRLQFSSDNSPDMITILIGVNDISVIETASEDKELAFSMVVSQLKQFLDSLHSEYTCPILLMEPFLFSWPAYLISWMATRDRLSDAFAKIAKSHNIPYLTLHRELNQLALKEGINNITIDGIHLTKTGHRFLAQKWLAFKTSGKL